MSKNKRPNFVDSQIAKWKNRRQGADPEGERQAVMEGIIMRKLDELSMNRFKWINMPDSVDIRNLERLLHRNALAVFYFEPKYDKFLALNASQRGENDYNDNPIGFTIRGGRFINRHLTAQQCVPIWANNLRVPDTDVTMLYAQRLATIDRTLEINSLSARQPRILVADEHSRLTAENYNREIIRGVPTIRVESNSSMAVEPPTVLDMGVDVDAFDKISIHRNRVWSECMTLLGISNANQDKKERLVESEVAANDEQIDMMKLASLNARMTAADRINRKYNLDKDVEVEFNSDITEELASRVADFVDGMDSMSKEELLELDKSDRELGV